jgi:hypothetical protein
MTSLGQLTYYKISERSAAGSLRYFGFGEMNYVKLEANEQFRTVSLMNLQLTVHTLLKLSETFSMAVAEDTSVQT